MSGSRPAPRARLARSHDRRPRRHWFLALTTATTLGLIASWFILGASQVGREEGDPGPAIDAAAWRLSAMVGLVVFLTMVPLALHALEITALQRRNRRARRRRASIEK